MKKTKSLFALLLVFVICIQFFPISANAYETIQYNSTGESVRTLQHMLNAVDNAQLNEGGTFGTGTLAAVTNFQQQHNLDVDGIVGPLTWSALISCYNKCPMKIGSGNYYPETLTAGQAYSISGTITSEKPLTSVTVGVYKTDGTATSQVKTVSPNTCSFNIHIVDNYIRFGCLSGGTYYFKVIAKDSANRTRTLVKIRFKVISKPVISAERYPVRLILNQSFSIAGTVTSKSKLIQVTIDITKKGKTSPSIHKTANPGTKTYNLGELDSEICFGDLGRGIYTYKISAKDETGGTASFSSQFKVLDVEKDNVVYKQTDSRWGDKIYYPGKTISGYACGAFSLMNCVHLLSQIKFEEDDVSEFCSYAVEWYIPGSGAQFHFFRPFCDKYGEEYNIRYICSIDVNDFESIRSYLLQGYMMDYRAPTHCLALAGYDAKNNKYLILDSAPNSNRQTAPYGYAWWTETQLINNMHQGLDKFDVIGRR